MTQYVTSIPNLSVNTLFWLTRELLKKAIRYRDVDAMFNDICVSVPDKYHDEIVAQHRDIKHYITDVLGMFHTLPAGGSVGINYKLEALAGKDYVVVFNVHRQPNPSHPAIDRYH